LAGAEIIGASIGFQMLTMAAMVDAIITIKYITSGIFHRRSFLWLLSDLNFNYKQILFRTSMIYGLCKNYDKWDI
jgi:hypothetical protein